MPHRWRGTAHDGRLKMPHGSADTDHIHQGIDGADFMKMHGFSLTAMNGSLGIGQGTKHPQHLRLQLPIQVRVLNLMANFSPVPCRRIRLQALDDDAPSPQATTARLVSIKPVATIETKGNQGALDHLQGHPEIDETSQQHVPSETGRTINVQFHRHPSSVIASVAAQG